MHADESNAVVGRARQALPPRARWTPEERLADMDSLGVDVHVLSPYSGFYNYQLIRQWRSPRPRTPIMRSTRWWRSGPNALPD